jgi:predicted N-acetyltransferase YhbS
MTANITVRQAHINDRSEITVLTNQLGYPSSEEKVGEILKVVMTHDDHEVFVAQKENEIVGYIHLVCTIRLGSDPFVEIAALVVDDSKRKQGIGKSLIVKAQEWANEKRYKYVRIRSNIIRESAHQFFENLGYINFKTQQVFVKNL